MTLINKKTAITKSSAQTKKLAEFLASVVASRKRNNPKNALVFALAGDLGSGKTTFVQGFLRAMGVRKRITSPTFTIIRNYKLAHHIDCYRIHKPAELLKLGFKEIINNPQNVVLIEWADRIKKLLPKKTIWLNFSHREKEQERIIKIKL